MIILVVLRSPKVSFMHDTFMFLLGNYKNRLTYMPNSTIVLRNLKKADEGWYAAEINYENGATVYNSVYLQLNGRGLLYDNVLHHLQLCTVLSKEVMLWQKLESFRH